MAGVNGVDTAGVKVLVADVGTHDAPVDAALRLRRDSTRVLVLNPNQSRQSAVAAVTRVMPYLSPAQAEWMVDRYLPDLAGEDPQAARRAPRVGWWRAATAVAATAAVAGWWFGGVTPPLEQGYVRDSLAAWDVRCDASDGWEAACHGSAGGRYTLTAYLASETVAISQKAGYSTVDYIVFKPDAVDDARVLYERVADAMGGVPGLDVALMVGPAGFAHFVLWGDSEVVGAMRVKAPTVGWDAT